MPRKYKHFPIRVLINNRFKNYAKLRQKKLYLGYSRLFSRHFWWIPANFNFFVCLQPTLIFIPLHSSSVYQALELCILVSYNTWASLFPLSSNYNNQFDELFVPFASIVTLLLSFAWDLIYMKCYHVIVQDNKSSQKINHIYKGLYSNRVCPDEPQALHVKMQFASDYQLSNEFPFYW